MSLLPCQWFTVYDPGGMFTLHGEEFAGHYNGNTIVPSTSGVSAARIEAQCLLRLDGLYSGTIDGIFGPNSQEATKDFQAYVNNSTGAGIESTACLGHRPGPGCAV